MKEHGTIPKYPVDLVPDDNATLMATLPDVPEVTTYGATREEALAQARAALIEMAGAYLTRGLDLPPASAARGRPTVALPAMAALKMALAQALRAERVTKVELARRMGIGRRQVDRLMDPTIASRVDDIEAALACLGRALAIDVHKAA